MNRTFSSVLLASSLLAAAPAMAGDIFQWQSNSLTYLNGRDFAVNPANQQTFTFEHADSWKYGDNFFFVDKIFYNGKGDATAGDNTYRHACRWARYLARSSSSARSAMC
ncbi:Uncharacterized protein AC514_2227 [Pseudomonas savastanoi pv. phaseolicola]|uniref:Nucleoside-binding outer membrane protein n=2 Tax=Pseudomonas savastanoi TaxID=29438 RepID=A0A3M3FXE5_PSESG|nr:Uncharacterized protein AC514_2227 [Pseudomonas savastanoi pv. phaseolicola]KPB69830.1 Uncharacterized protein AC508_1916 [Pseudomonas amygdali pv. mellea]RMM66550.1 hypothetical protein ALQ74_02343 [Pseudomonas savastanoi pv. glycinea]KPB41966.1 Uncharacterized protein AC513_5157 [Pseudomonas savastanoi pv. phaseolicola]KPB61516.1 Uncharacterized protein AC512_2120 [Pseudomonas savastanoi pv. phaseolicola]